MFHNWSFDKIWFLLKILFSVLSELVFFRFLFSYLVATATRFASSGKAPIDSKKLGKAITEAKTLILRMFFNTKVNATWKKVYPKIAAISLAFAAATSVFHNALR